MDEPDYTEIRDDRIRKKICELMSEMLDNPGECGIYPTSRFMWKMETFILAEIEQLRTALRRAAGELSTHPPHTREHPQAVYENLLKAAPLAPAE